MKTKQLLFALLAMIFSAAMFSCSDGDTEGSGKLNVRMTDAPFPTDLVAEANVTISKIDIRQAGESEGSSFITILDTEVSANLLDLTNGVTANLTSVDIPVGSYNLVRLYVSEASVVLKDGTSYDLTVPSGAQTGIKVFIDPAIQVEGGLTAELLLDVDVASSFVPKGGLDIGVVTGFIFKPVIKASNESFAGRLTGAVTTEAEGESTAVAGAQVAVFAADTLNTTTFADAEGSYTILGLAAGSYDVTVEAEGYVSATTENVEIVAANATTTNFQLTAEE